MCYKPESIITFSLLPSLIQIKYNYIGINVGKLKKMKYPQPKHKQYD